MPDWTGDDAFFILADGRELFQRRLVEIARRSGVNAPPVVEAFSREIATAYDELAASARQDGFEQTDGLTASRISLVGNDDLELEIRIGDLVNRLKQNERIDRWRVQLRYMTLLDRPKMSAETNPAGLEPISRGLWAICRASNASLEQNLGRLDRLEEQLQAGLPDVYLELNSLLERRGIVPTQVRPILRGAGSATLGVSATGAQEIATSANALSALQQKLRQRLGDETARDNASTGNIAGESSNAALNTSQLTALNHLMERLNELESVRGVAQTSAQSLGGSGAHEPAQSIRASDLGLPLGKPAAIALDTLSMIFDAIFAAPDLPEVVKAIIGRLQIPLLKIAILDGTFFSSTRHPARQLINRMARATVGLSRDVGRDHPICRHIANIADEARAALETNDGNLAPHLDQLERMIEDRDQSIQLKSQPYMQLVLEHEQRLNAKTNAQSWLRDTLMRCTEASIRSFLSDYWIRVMQGAAESGGLTGTRWKESKATIDELLWSIQPKQTPEERKRLAALVPSLLKRFNAELDALKVSTEERAPFLNACFDLQTAALRNRPDLSAQPLNFQRASPTSDEPSLTCAAPASSALSAEVLERDGKLVQYLGSPPPAQSARRTKNALAKQGEWIATQLPDEDSICGRLCGEAADTGSVLLFNPDWGYAVAMSRPLLEQQVTEGKARALSANALFDDAAERALAQIARE